MSIPKQIIDNYKKLDSECNAKVDQHISLLTAMRLMPSFIAHAAVRMGGCIAWEWPQKWEYWKYPEMIELVSNLQLELVLT